MARKTGWVVKTNPYEGGSDHTVFGSAGMPSLLDWHFTDRYYHTNFDTPDKTSPAEMRNVGVAVRSDGVAARVGDRAGGAGRRRLVAAAGRARVAFEEREGAKLAAADANRQPPHARRPDRHGLEEVVRRGGRVGLAPGRRANIAGVSAEARANWPRRSTAP